MTVGTSPSATVARLRGRRRGRLQVLAACSIFAATTLQSITVTARTDELDAQLVSAFRVDNSVSEEFVAAMRRLAAAGGLPDDDTSSRFVEMVEQALAQAPARTAPSLPVAAPPIPVPTAASAPITTTTVPPTTVPPTTVPPTTVPPTTVPPTTVPPTTVPPTTVPPPPVPAATTSASPASAAVEAEQRFAQLINQERADRGLAALQVDVDIRAVARNWSEELRREADRCGAGALRHNPSYGEQMPAGWRSAAENVSCGGAVEPIHQAFMNSPAHRRNILNGLFTHVGVGVSIAPDGTMWVTQNFGEY